MGVTFFKTIVRDKTSYNSRYHLFDLELVSPSLIDFQAGQFVMITVPGDAQKKSYSITSPPEANHKVELLVDIKPGGAGSKFFENLSLGDQVELMGPAGLFVVANFDPKVEHSEENLVFVATGSGIAPIRSMILDLLITKKDQRQIILFWGMRHEVDTFWLEDFYKLSRDYANFDFELILSQPNDDWTLSKGYVTDLVAHRVGNFSQTGFYLCGGRQMIKDVTTLLTDKKHVNPNQIHLERFY